MRSLKKDSTSLKAVQKILINSVGERDYSAQKTCHLLLQLSMCLGLLVILLCSAWMDLMQWRSTWKRTSQQQHHQHWTLHHCSTSISAISGHDTAALCPALHDVQGDWFRPIPQEEECCGHARPYCSPNPHGPKYEQYCLHKLMFYVPFRCQDDLLSDNNTFAAAYAIFLQSGNVPPSLRMIFINSSNYLNSLQRMTILRCMWCYYSMWSSYCCLSVLY